MTDPVFERYKDALKAGHVAALRGRLEDALEHYRGAAALADERPLPHASAGGVLLRLGRADDALSAYDAALARSRRDEGALVGRADALAALGRSAEAATALDALADVRRAAGRPAEALDALRRGLGLDPTDARRAACLALAAELGVADEAVMPDAAPVDAPDRDTGDAREGTVGPGSPGTETAEPARDPAAPDPARHLAAAESLLVGGDRNAAAYELIAAADGYAARDLLDAALESAGQALRVAPDLPAVHLALARLYFRRGWRERAAETLLLLDRFLEIEGDADGRRATAALARQHLSADPRLERLAGAAGPRQA